MAEKLGDAVLHLRTDDSALDDGLKRARGKAEGLATDFDALGQRMVGIGSKLSIGLTAPLILFGRQSTLAASDAAELQSAFNVTFGDMSAAMNEWAEKTGDAMGRSTQEMQRGANMFGLFFNQAAPTKQAAAEMSQSFAVLAQDLSSFYNVDPGVALEKLRSGLSGETEPLRDFGIFLNEATVAAKALEMGLAGTTKELTEQDKVMARAALIMEATKNAQGDVARTSDGTANQIRKSKAAWEELQVTVGTKLLPAVTPLITVVGDLLTGFSQLPGPVQTGVVGFLALSAAVGPLLMGIGGLIGPIAGMITGLRGLKAGFDFAGLARSAIPIIGMVGKALMGLALNPVFLTIAALVAGIYLAWKNWDKIKPVIDAVGAAVSGWWNGTVKPVLDTVISGIEQLVAIFRDTFGGQIKAVVDLVSALLKGDFAGAWEAAKAFVTSSVRGWLNVLDTLVPGAKIAIANLINGFSSWFGQVTTQMVGYGRNIIDGLARGIRAAPQAVWNALKDVVLAGIKNIREFLGIRSPSRLFMEMGGHITDGLAIGIRGGTGSVAEAMRQLAGVVGAGLSPTAGAGADFEPPAEAGKSWRDGFRQWFRDGLRAAMDGDLGGFLSNWLSGIGQRMLDRLADQLADMLSGVIQSLIGGIGGSSSGGIGGIVSGIGGLLGGLLGGIGGGASGAGAGIAGLAGMFATGGRIPLGQFGIVGEAGPEPVISTPRGAVVRPNRALGEAMGQQRPSVVVPISIDATGADPAALERVRAEVAGLRRELPGTIISTMQDANERRIVRGNTW